MLQVAITCLAGLSGLGLGVALTKRISEARKSDPELAVRFVVAGLATTLVVGLCVSAVYVAAAHTIAGWLLRNSAESGPIVASAGSILFTAVQTTTQGALVGAERFRSVSASQVLQSALPALGLVVGAAAGRLTGALWGFSLGNALAAIASLLLLWSAGGNHAVAVNRGLGAVVWRGLLPVGGAALLAFMVVTAALLVGQLLLAYRPHGYAQVALFNISYRWHLAVLLLPGALATVLLPTMTRLRAEGNIAESAELFRFNVRLAAATSAAGALVLAVGASLLLGLSGAYYASHVAPLRVLMAAAVPGTLNSVLSSASISLGALKAWLVSDLVLAVVFLGAAVLLIPESGATGLAIAYLGGYVATDASLLRPLARRLPPKSLR